MNSFRLDAYVRSMTFTCNRSAYNLLLSGSNTAAVTGNSGTVRKNERIRLLNIILLLLISDDAVIVVGVFGNDGTNNNRERKMIGSEIIDRVRVYMNQKEKTIGERFTIRYVLHTENNNFSMGKLKYMGNKRFSEFVPNHKKWGKY